MTTQHTVKKKKSVCMKTASLCAVRCGSRLPVCVCVCVLGTRLPHHAVKWKVLVHNHEASRQ